MDAFFVDTAVCVILIIGATYFLNNYWRLF